MCPVRCVTYVSGRSFSESASVAPPAFASLCPILINVIKVLRSRFEEARSLRIKGRQRCGGARNRSKNVKYRPENRMKGCHGRRQFHVRLCLRDLHQRN